MKTAPVPVIADIQYAGPFRVYDMNTDSYIYSYLDRSAPGDIPPDIAALPVKGLYMVDTVLYIYTEVK